MAVVGCVAAHEAAAQSETAAGGASFWPARRARRAAARQAACGRLAAAYLRVEALEKEVRGLEAQVAAMRERHAEAAEQAFDLAGRQGDPSAAEPNAVLCNEIVACVAVAVPVVEEMLAAGQVAGCGEASASAGAAEAVAGAARVAKPAGAPRAKGLERARRNAGLHCPPRRGASIARMPLQALNRLQRPGGAVACAGARRPGSRGVSASGLRRRQPAARPAIEAAPADWMVAARRGRSLPVGARFEQAQQVRPAEGVVEKPLAGGPRWWTVAAEQVEAELVAGVDADGPIGGGGDDARNEGGEVLGAQAEEDPIRSNRLKEGEL
ncbi:unnamed protein product [Prorocentrum cordatum]|uniref:Uncharacterized protein n=1 Tax=Prorocentrum cordatum TaxID=2364126 RepID=A0ABN9SE48_9DINO|nr:unnamed protein product [Polarella glacialis]